MGKIAAKAINFTLNSVVIEDELKDFSLDIKVETPVVTSFADAGPRRVNGNYDWSEKLSGFFDGAASQGDATLFGLLASAGVAAGFDPTGNSAGTNDPNFDGTVVLSDYSIKGSAGGAVEYSATLEGTSALTRAVA